jgi:hypothetical protein
VIFTESEIRDSLEKARAAFSRFSDWDYNNEVDGSYSGFALWGEFVSELDESMPRSFFVTFDTYQATWMGHLTIGKHCYFWSEADFGDAHLVESGPCPTLEDAIASLKQRMTDLFRALCGLTSETATPEDYGRD